MMRKNLYNLFFAAVFVFSAAFCAVGAEPVLFTRSGKIISTAKIAKPAINLPNDLPADPVFIEVTIQPDKNRKFSIFDYSLEVMNFVTVPCIAIKIGDGQYSTENKEFSPDGKNVSLLFAAASRDCVDDLPAKVKINTSGNVKALGTSVVYSPPYIESPNSTVSSLTGNAQYIFFAVEIAPVVSGEQTMVSCQLNALSMSFPNGTTANCIAIKTQGKNYSCAESANIKKDTTAVALFAVKAKDCIDDLPFKLRFNLATSGNIITTL